MTVLERLRGKLAGMIGLAALVYAALIFWSDGAALLRTLRGFQLQSVGLVLGSVLVGYVFRFLRWQFYLRCLGIACPLPASLRIFLSGLAMVITPGKVGEVLKSFLLHKYQGTPVSTSAPVVVAERLTDLLAVVLLALAGFLAYGSDPRLAWLALAGCAATVAILSVKPAMLWFIGLLAKLPLLGRAAPTVARLYLSGATLLRPLPLVVATLLGIIGWGCECLGLYLALLGLGAPDPSLPLSAFVFAGGTLTGVLTPGGLGVTDAFMVGMLVQSGLSPEVASSATLIIRGATLWFAVLIGCLTLIILPVEAEALDKPQ